MLGGINRDFHKKKVWLISNFFNQLTALIYKSLKLK